MNPQNTDLPSNSPENRARMALTRQIAAGAAHYDRRRILPRLLPLGPDLLQGEEPAISRTILLYLARALRDQRRRGRSGHWTYDLNKHMALAQAYQAEKAALKNNGAKRGV